MKTYLIGIKNNNRSCGNEGTRITEYKRHSKIMEIARNFKKMYKHDEVYAITNYSQKMCEMNNSQFVSHVRRNGKRLL